MEPKGGTLHLINSKVRLAREPESAWKDIKGYEGYYWINQLGQVKRIDANKLLSPGKSNGYNLVYLWKNGEGRGVSIHRLLAETFIPNPENKAEVNHINGIRGDDRLDNLEWVTRDENMAHASRLELFPSGEQCHLSKLNELQVRVIRKSPDLTQRELGKIFGVSHNNIGMIKRGILWKHIN